MSNSHSKNIRTSVIQKEQIDFDLVIRNLQARAEDVSKCFSS